MTIRNYLCLALIVPFTASATPAAPAGFLRVAPAYAAANQKHLERALQTGVSARYAFATLKARYAAAEDRRYLDEIHAALPADYVYSFASYKAVPRGYALTLASGQKLTVASDQKNRLVIGGKVIDARLSARGAFEAVDARLNARHAGLLQTFDLLPRAEAATAIEYGLVAALIAVGIIAGLDMVSQKLSGPKLAPKKKTAVAPAVATPVEVKAAAATLDQALLTCEQERGQIKFVDSVSADLLKTLQDEQTGADLLADVDCEKYPAAVAARAPKVNSADIKVVCFKAKTYQACLKKFRDEAATPAQVSGAAVTPSAK